MLKLQPFECNLYTFRRYTLQDKTLKYKIEQPDIFLKLLLNYNGYMICIKRVCGGFIYRHL